MRKVRWAVPTISLKYVGGSKLKKLTEVSAILIVLVWASLISVVSAKNIGRERAFCEDVSRIVSQYKGVFTKPPMRVPTSRVADGPIMGNGDIGVVISGEGKEQRFWISKCDFWKAKRGLHKGGGPMLIGGIDIRIPALAGATYNIEQIIYEPEIVSTFSKAGTTVTMRSWVAACENLLVIELACTGNPVGVEVRPWVKTSDDSTTEKGVSNQVYWFTRKFDSPDLDWPSEAVIAVRRIGTGTGVHMIKPGQKVIVAASILTNWDRQSYLNDARERVSQLTFKDINQIRASHEKWWRDFWSKSSVEIGDPLIEKFWYGSQYIIACCSRNKNFPPGLFGNWTTTDTPGWAGDYHLNYNYQASWWGVYSSNQVELSEPYDAPILDFIPRGKFYAKRDLDCRGVYYPVGIGPKGLDNTVRLPDSESAAEQTEEGCFWGQKSNAAYAAVNMLMRFYYTYDLEYVRKVYPYLIEVVNFWEDYLKFEGGRYIIYNDSIHEGSGNDMNPLLSLGFVRMVFKGAIDMSIELDVDANRHKRWRHILENISQFPLQQRDGKTVFRYSEKGTDWWSSNTLGIQHIWPAGQIGLGSKKELLKIAKNTITVLNRWKDNNGFPNFHTAAARVGYDPKIILKNLREQCRNHSYPNLFIYYGGGGIECCSGVVSCINEMLLQSYENVLRFFPVWPKDMDARFYNLRAVGAFLVSSALKNGNVQYVEIQSEKGRDCMVQNPWLGKAVTVYRNGKKAKTIRGEILTFGTTKGEKISLRPSE